MSCDIKQELYFCDILAYSHTNLLLLDIVLGPLTIIYLMHEAQTHYIGGICEALIRDMFMQGDCSELTVALGIYNLADGQKKIPPYFIPISHFLVIFSTYC